MNQRSASHPLQDLKCRWSAATPVRLTRTKVPPRPLCVNSPRHSFMRARPAPHTREPAPVPPPPRSAPPGEQDLCPRKLCPTIAAMPAGGQRRLTGGWVGGWQASSLGRRELTRISQGRQRPEGLPCGPRKLVHPPSPAALADDALIHRSVPGQTCLQCQHQCPGTQSGVHQPSTLPPLEDTRPFRFSAALLLRSQPPGGKQTADSAADHFTSPLWQRELLIRRREERGPRRKSKITKALFSIFEL